MVDIQMGFSALSTDARRMNGAALPTRMVAAFSSLVCGRAGGSTAAPAAAVAARAASAASAREDRAGGMVAGVGEEGGGHGGKVSGRSCFDARAPNPGAPRADRRPRRREAAPPAPASRPDRAVVSLRGFDWRAWMRGAAAERLSGARRKPRNARQARRATLAAPTKRKRETANARRGEEGAGKSDGRRAMRVAHNAPLPLHSPADAPRHAPTPVNAVGHGERTGAGARGVHGQQP